MLQIIESSSHGNCAYLEWGGVRVLIDAGIGIRRIEAYLKTLGLTLENIDAVFLTHEHTDHRKALPNMTKFKMKVFANRLTSESLRYLVPETRELQWNIFEDGVPFNFGALKVTGFSIPHDTSDAVGYSFTFANRTLVWATDLGKVTFSVRDIVQNASVLVLESNYCPKMLEASSRPFNLKARIAGTHGHLSNADAIELLRTLNPDKIEKIFLAHISRECNKTEHIRELLTAAPLESIFQRIEIVSPFSKHSTAYGEREISLKQPTFF